MKRLSRTIAGCAVALALLGAAACSDSDTGIGASARAPELGAYLYDVTFPLSDTGPSIDLDGELDIRTAHRDTITARWQVVGYAGSVERGFWNINAYALPATPTTFQGTVTHRIWRASTGTNLNCRASYEMVEMDDTFRTTTTCSLTR